MLIKSTIYYHFLSSSNAINNVRSIQDRKNLYYLITIFNFILHLYKFNIYKFILKLVSLAIIKIFRVLNLIFNLIVDILYALPFIILIFVTLLAACSLAIAQEKGTKENPFRIALVKNDSYWAYIQFEIDFKKSLEEFGWLDKVTFPEELQINWDDVAPENYKELAIDLLERDDIDLVVSFGSETSRLLIDNNTKGINILGMCIYNPITAGLVSNNEYSGNPHFTTAVFDNSPAQTMFTVIHEMFNFKKMGILYTDSIAIKSYSFVDEARSIARNRGFQLIEYDKVDESQGMASCMNGLDYLLDQGIDAIFVPGLPCFDVKRFNLKDFYSKIYENKIISITGEDWEQMRLFAMVGFITLNSRVKITKFHAQQAIDILSGVSPGDINMATAADIQLTLNLDGADRLGLEFDLHFLTNMDVIFLDLVGLE
jgi:ABC-type uncharacterized transport system substrate-binding protein